MRILVDYRPALRARTGVGEYIHELVRAYAATHVHDEVTLWTSSWKDRPPPGLGSALGVRVVDRRVPVRVLNYLWHRRQWPPVEALAGRYDVVHAAHPLLIPSSHAAQVVTVHDLFFLDQPDHTHAEIRRDYPVFAGEHARRADAVITSSSHVKQLVIGRLGVPPAAVHVCPFGAPAWRQLGGKPNIAADGYVLFVGTLEPRKNLGVLLDAYERLIARRRDVPKLVIAGRATPAAADWLERAAREPLRGHVELRGYVPDAEREALYAGARAVVLPSRDEGFGIPALEAMSAGVPVMASRRGSLPEVIGSGGLLLDATDADVWADAIERVAFDAAYATAQARAGLARAATFSWDTTARALHDAYRSAIARRQRRGLVPAAPE